MSYFPDQFVDVFSFMKIPYELVDRRPGDVASCYASCSLAEKELGWRAERNLTDMCK